MFLDARCYDVMFVESGNDACERIKAILPDVVIGCATHRSRDSRTIAQNQKARQSPDWMKLAQKNGCARVRARSIASCAFRSASARPSPDCRR